MANNEENNSNTHNEDIELNGFKHYCVFDTGSTVNIISDKIYNFLKHKPPINYSKRKTIIFLDGSKMYLDRSVELNVCYNNKSITDTFYIVKKPVVDLLIGNKMVVKLDKKKFSKIRCPINTKVGTIISWSRPIRDQEKKD